MLILLGGLPGSGKSPYLDQLEREGWEKFDDFQASANSNSSLFRDARRFPELIEALKRGRRCVVSDMRIVCTEYRDDAYSSLTEEVQDLSIEWQIFENDPVQCAVNIRKGSRPIDDRLAKLEEYSKKYVLTEGVVPMAVWR